MQERRQKTKQTSVHIQFNTNSPTNTLSENKKKILKLVYPFGGQINL